MAIDHNHHVAHAGIAYWKAHYDRSVAESESPESSYTEKASARAAQNTWYGPELSHHLQRHLQRDHRNELDEAWPYVHELLAHHDSLHCQRCEACLTDDDGASWPFCPECDWCPDCGVTHEPHPDRRDREPHKKEDL